MNVYNEGTLQWLARKGATRICLPPELPLASVAVLARAGRDAGVAIEVWGHGRAPLAISGRCYHARLHDRIKDACLFVCGEDPDGRDATSILSSEVVALARRDDSDVWVPTPQTRPQLTTPQALADTTSIFEIPADLISQCQDDDAPLDPDALPQAASGAAPLLRHALALREAWDQARAMWTTASP